MNAVKRDGIDRVNMLDSILFQPVALESVLLLLNLQTWVQILHSYTSFDWTQDIALEPAKKIRTNNPTSSHMNLVFVTIRFYLITASFIRTVIPVCATVYLFVWEGSNAASLVLETRLSSLLYIAHVPQIPHQDSSSGCANDQPISSHRQGVHLSQIWHVSDERNTTAPFQILLNKMPTHLMRSYAQITTHYCNICDSLSLKGYRVLHQWSHFNILLSKHVKWEI